MPKESKMKTKLIKASVFMLIIGLGFVAYPFINSLAISEKSKNDSIGSCSVKDMKPGDIIQCKNASIYKRTNKDKEYFKAFAYLLADPQSIYSTQPKNTNKLWRSSNVDYFIYYSWSTRRGCTATLQEPESYKDIKYEPPEAVATKVLPFFVEQCDGRRWDTSGRLYHRDGNPEEYNLEVPETEWVSESTVHVFGGKA